MNTRSELGLVLLSLLVGAIVGLVAIECKVYHLTKVFLLTSLILLPYIKIKYNNIYLSCTLSALSGYLLLPIVIYTTLQSLSGLLAAILSITTLIIIPALTVAVIVLARYRTVAIVFVAVLNIYFLITFYPNVRWVEYSVILIMLVPFLIKLHSVKDIEGTDIFHKSFYLVELAILFNLCLALSKIIFTNQ